MPYLLPPLPEYKPSQIANISAGQIGGPELGAYSRLLAGTWTGTEQEYSGFLVTQHNPVRNVRVVIEQVEQYMNPAKNFDRMIRIRLQKFITYSYQFQLWMHAQPRALSIAVRRKFFNALENEWNNVTLAFERGFPERVLVETGDLTNNFRLAKGIKFLDQIPNLANQDTYEYRAREIMDATNIVRGEIEQLRETFER